MLISMVVALSENLAIGKNNQLLWHLPADLKHFKQLTTGHTVIMGRKTYDSIGKPLPNRRNIVISKQQNPQIEGIEWLNSLQKALALCQNETEVFIIGGGQIYLEALPLSHTIYVTKVHTNIPDADTFFPPIDAHTWQETEKETHQADEKNGYDYTFSRLVRR